MLWYWTKSQGAPGRAEARFDALSPGPPSWMRAQQCLVCVASSKMAQEWRGARGYQCTTLKHNTSEHIQHRPAATPYSILLHSREKPRQTPSLLTFGAFLSILFSFFPRRLSFRSSCGGRSVSLHARRSVHNSHLPNYPSTEYLCRINSGKKKL